LAPPPACEAGWPTAKQGGSCNAFSGGGAVAAMVAMAWGCIGAPIVAGVLPSAPPMCTPPIYYPTATHLAPFLSPPPPPCSGAVTHEVAIVGEGAQTLHVGVSRPCHLPWPASNHKIRNCRWIQQGGNCQETSKKAPVLDLRSQLVDGHTSGMCLGCLGVISNQ
jgi:hypothetical protein